MNLRELPPIAILFGLGLLVLGGVLVLTAPSALAWFLIFIGITNSALVVIGAKLRKADERREQ